MKNKFKTKKLFVSSLAVILSMIVFMMSTNAAFWPVNIYEVFEYENEMPASEFIYSNMDNNRLYVVIDLSCYNSTMIDQIYAGLDVKVSYYNALSGNPATSTRSTAGDTFYSYETEDSDEMILYINNYDRGFSYVVIEVTVTYTLYFFNGGSDTCSYLYTCIPHYNQYSRNPI